MDMNNQLQLVTFEQAKRLKAAGFDWETLRYFHADGEFLDDDADKSEYNWNSSDVKTLTWLIHGDNHPDEADVCSAPTVALALKWMRDKHKLSGEVYASASGWLLHADQQTTVAGR